MMYDPDFKYCPSCKDEFRPEIEECADCGERLVSGEEMNSRPGMSAQRTNVPKGELGPEDDLVAVRHGPMAEMKAYKNILEQSGIASILAGDESSCGKGCCGGNFDLVVRREEASGAVQIIEDEIRRTSVIDIDQEIPDDSLFDPLAKDNTCPACGHRFSGGVVCPDCGLCF